MLFVPYQFPIACVFLLLGQLLVSCLCLVIQLCCYFMGIVQNVFASVDKTVETYFAGVCVTRVHSTPVCGLCK